MKYFSQVITVVAAFFLVHVVSVSSHHPHHHHHNHHTNAAKVRGSASVHGSSKKEDAQAAVAAPPPSTSAPADPIHLEMQKEVEIMERKIDELKDVEDATQFAGKIAVMEGELVKTGEAAVGVMLMDRISKVRANLCAEHHLISAEIQECKTFMQKACSHHDTQSPHVPAEKCSRFFLHSKTRVHEAGAAPAPAAYPNAFSPAASPMGEVDERGLTAAQKAEALRIWTKGGKQLMPMPDQGFSGEKVNHHYMHTMTDDWQLEFGPAADHKSFIEVCADHPNNEWCRLHGYYKEQAPKSEEWYNDFGKLHSDAKPTLIVNGMALLAVALLAAVM